MSFENQINIKKVILIQKDIQKSKALIKMSNNNLEYISKLEVTEIASTIIFTTCYDSLRQILEAMTLKEGYKLLSHEAYTHYLKHKNEFSTAEKFDRFRKLRNGANYYAESIPINVTINAKIEIKKIIDKLKKNYLSNI